MLKKLATLVFVFLLISLPMSTALEIHENTIRVTELDSDSAKVKWETDMDSYGYVDYGISSNNMDTVPETGGTTSYHSVELNDLYPGQKYYYKVRAEDGYSDVDESAFYEFTTLLAPPENLEVKTVGHDSATLEWESVSSSQKYRVFVNDNVKATTTTNSAEITDLSTETQYNAYVRAVDSEDRMSSPSNEVSFTTKEKPYNISFVEVTGVTNTSAVISWETSREVKGAVEYDTDMNLGRRKEESSATKKHSITLDGLTPDTDYYYKIISGSDETEAESFKTRESDSDTNIIEIIDISVDSVEKDSATISWKTNIPAEGEVKYGTDENLDANKKEAEKTTDHSVTLDNLLSTTKYYFKIFSKGASSSFKNFNTKTSKENFLNIKSLPGLTSKPKVNVSGTTAVNARVYIFTNGNDQAQVREVINGTKFKFPVKLSSMAKNKGKKGMNKITVMSWDVNGNKDTARKYVRYDSSPPPLDIKNVPSLTGADAINVKGESEKGAKIKFFLDDQQQATIEKLEKPNFEKEINIGHNRNSTFKVTAEDKAGNIETYKKKITIDTTAPEIEFNNTWSPTHFKLYRIWGKTEPGAKIKAVNLGDYGGCEEAAEDLDYVSCSEFLDQEKVSAQVDPVSYAVGLQRETTADSNGEFSLVMPMVMSTKEGTAKETRNNLQINVTDKAGNQNEYEKSLMYRPGCSDWSIGKIKSYPFNIYTSDLSAGDISGSAFFPVHYNGAGDPEVLNVAIGEDSADASGKVVNPDKEFLSSGSNEMVSTQMENNNKYVTIGNPKASAYKPGEKAFNVYAPVTIDQYTGPVSKLPDVMYAYMSVNIEYEGPQGKTSCEVYPKVSFDIQKPENVADWMSPEQINNTIEGLEEAINYTEEAVKYSKKASQYGMLACGGMIAWQYIKGLGGGGDDSGEGCSDQEKEMKNVYRLCDRVLCPSAPPKCNEFEEMGNYQVGGDNVDKNEFQEQVRKNTKCRNAYKEADPEERFDSWRKEDGNNVCEGYSPVTSPTYRNELPSSGDSDEKARMNVDYYRVEGGKVVNGPGQEAEVEGEDQNIKVNIQLSQNELNNMAQQECGRKGSGTLIVSQTSSTSGEARRTYGAKERVYSEEGGQCIEGKTPSEVLSGGKTKDPKNIGDDYARPDENKISGCYDESCPQFDGTKCPKWFGFSGEGGDEGTADINPPEGLWSSLKCVCLPGIMKHLQNYLKMMKGAKKCMEQARMGETRGGFCERLMAQFVCDLTIEALKFAISLDYSKGAEGERGVISNYKENSQKVTDSLSNRYSGVVDEKLGLSSDQLVHKACIFAITQDWSMMEGVFDNYIDQVDVEPVVSIQGESRPYGYDPFTGKMSIGYNIYVGVVPGGDTNLRLVLKCNPEKSGGDYCGPDADPIDVTSKLQRNHLTSDDHAINKNIRFQRDAEYWYNVVELQLDYQVGDEQKTKTVTKTIWRKGELANNCYFDVTKGIYCESYSGFAGDKGKIQLHSFDSDSRISPNPPGPFVPGNNIGAVVKTMNRFDGNAYLRFETDNEEIEYEIEGSGQRTAESREGGEYYNLWVDNVKESGSSERVISPENSDILDGDEIKIDDSGEIEVEVSRAKYISLLCEGTATNEDGDEKSFSNEKEITNEDIEEDDSHTIQCFSEDEYEDYDDFIVDKVIVKGVKPRDNALDGNGIGVKVKDKDYDINIETDSDEDTRSGSEDITMNIAEDTSGNRKGDTPILYDTESQETETSYQVQNKNTGNPPSIDWVEPLNENIPGTKIVPIGFNIWTDDEKLEELVVEIDGKGMENEDVDCEVKIEESKEEGKEYEENCDDVFKIKAGRLTYFGDDDKKIPPFFELYLEWNVQKENGDDYRNQDAIYDISVTATSEDDDSDTKTRRFKPYPGELRKENVQVTLGGPDCELDECLEYNEDPQELSTTENKPPSTSKQ